MLNGGRVSAASRERVHRAVSELGYSPSVAAQSLVTRRVGCVGLVAQSSQSPWFGQILAGIEEALANSRSSVLLTSMMAGQGYDPSVVEQWIRTRRVDGLLIVSYGERDVPLLQAAQAAGLPVALIAPELPEQADLAVRSDNVDAGRLAASHLLELGHRQFAFAGGPRSSADTRNRLRGFEERLAEEGVQLPPEGRWYAQAYGWEGGAAFGREFLSRPRSQWPTAVVAGNDPAALGFIRTLLAAGVSVPGDVSVVGFDGTPDGEQFFPGLTTVSQPTRQMAEHACRGLLGIVGAAAAVERKDREYPVELLVRESTSAPRAAVAVHAAAAELDRA